MADNVAGEHEQHEHEPSFVESVTEKISETFHKEDSSDSDGEAKKSSPVTDLKDKVYRLVGRERPVHKVLGGGKAADIFLWKDKKVSAGVLGFATVIWFPKVALPEDIVLGVASAIRTEINTSLAILRNIASGKDLKKFLAVIAGLCVTTRVFKAFTQHVTCFTSSFHNCFCCNLCIFGELLKYYDVEWFSK
ncbi:hypothetical protein HanXRQr2_Chr10g0439791 [Helianthus annuus]|uniref:Reticulon domain-containing protein n=1 Tax=Helianthus annuus TaxID=4232 RepID=A0A9K3HXK3_HELAN|nr:hypothetical protein HanXRQr2_Chr10g0439791 [Helianthus annuus]KAJ0521693.1 hypothetical protein HanIR_Chr10g0473941 [Helianthus annuus]KAJ0529887.1 hypothetical protein HanHA89_Chr10g0383231 [Helianthus annuus]